jgi:L-alanine-DL-glutamate epimerase-like enolase superfamily enzyme
LHQLLGGCRSEVEVSIGGGYYRERREEAEIVDELARYVERGFRHIKIPAGGLAPAAEEHWVELARGAVGSDVALALDTHWTWTSIDEAVLVLKRLEQFDLSWVEDPLWPEAVTATADLRRRVSTPIAFGDELSGRWAYQNMLTVDAADIWRVDATCVGGISEFRKIAAVAATWGIRISTHIYPEIHIHCAAADEAVMGIEYVDPEADIDLSYRFVTPRVAPRDGRATAPTGPGLGIEIDWSQIESIAVEKVEC